MSSLLPPSFSTTGECPPLSNSSSTVTVRLSSTMTQSGSVSRDGAEVPVNDGSRNRSCTESNLSRVSSYCGARAPTRPGMPPSSYSFNQGFADSNASPAQRMRSASEAAKKTHANAMNSSEELPVRWWKMLERTVRSWDDDHESGQKVPSEQKLAFQETKTAICHVLGEIFGIAGPIVFDALELCQLCPFPALQTISEALIRIWKAVEGVEMNRLAFLRLAHSCATILDAIRKEVTRGGQQLEGNLFDAMEKLEGSFKEVQDLAEHQNNVPWLRRYLARHECERSIKHCHEQLLRAVNAFQITVHIRILGAVMNNPLYNKTEEHLQAIVGEALTNWHRRNIALSPPLSPSHPPGLPPSSSHRSLSFSNSSASPTTPASNPPPEPVCVLREIQTARIEEDAKLDLEDLRQSMREMTHTGKDVDLVSFMQIEREEMPEAIKTLQRTLESKSRSNAPQGSGHCKDNLEQEFLESGIDALRRISSDVDTSLPNWTITKYELQVDKKVGSGYTARVCKGVWRGRTVALKFLDEATPASLFVQEINVWKSLEHPNVLQLYGASSATGEPPWFFVSPFLKHGSLSQFLKCVSVQQDYDSEGLGSMTDNLPYSKSRSSLRHAEYRVLKPGDMYRILQDVAKGMQYLHERNVLHGDLKGANVLLDDYGKCVIADFGQSEIKSEVFRLTGKLRESRHGTFRWRAPELMDGTSGLTQATDVYAYGITCAEALSMGEVPWATDDDASVRFLVLQRDRRPLIPDDFSSPVLRDLINACWHRDPSRRPSFSSVVEELQKLKETTHSYHEPLFSPKIPEMVREDSVISPQMSSQCSRLSWTPSMISADGIDSDDYVTIPHGGEIDAMCVEETIPTPSLRRSEPVHYHPDGSLPSRRFIYKYSDSDIDLRSTLNLGRAGSPYPEDETTIEIMNERRYRLYLEHRYHYSLSVPLWTPSVVELGDVGYLERCSGAFVTLFNAFKPSKTPRGLPKGMPSIAGYGPILKGVTRQSKRNVAQKGLDVVTGFLSFRSRTEVPISRRQSFTLRAGHKCAHLYTESTEYQYLRQLDAPKAWFAANVNNIISLYGREHSFQREDLNLVVGAIQAQHHALFVSHQHPDGQAHFNVFSIQKKGQPWGMFTTDTNIPNGRDGPCYDEPSDSPVLHVSASKVSTVGEPPKAVLLSRLRFRPDEQEPTRH